MNVYWSPLHGNVFTDDVFLFAPDECPQFVQLQAASADADKHAVMQLGATTADTRAKAHDRIAVNASQPFNGADRHALSEGGDDFNLLVAGKVVHGGPNPSFGEKARGSGK